MKFMRKAIRFIAIPILASSIFLTDCNTNKIPSKPQSEIGNIIYTRGEDGVIGKLYTSDIYGENERLVLDCDSCMQPTFSPDGAKIAYIKQIGEDISEIFLIDSDREETRLTTLETITKDPTWSPDGSKLAFSSTGLKGNKNKENLDIYIINLNGEELRRLTQNNWVDEQPSWANNGQWIFFVSNKTGASNLYTMRSDGSNKIAITNNSDYNAYWPLLSNDGLKLLYTIEEITNEGNSKIIVRDFLSGEELGLTNSTYVSGRFNRAIWDKAGKKALLVSSSKESENMEISLFDTKYYKITKITNNNHNEYFPHWRKDKDFETFLDKSINVMKRFRHKKRI